MRNPLRILKRIVIRFRDAITGRYVSEDYARRHPDTTVRERDHDN